MIAIWILLSLSAAYWLVMALLVLRASRRTPRLGRVHAPELTNWPRLSLIVPARDEADTLGPALQSRLAEDYPALEVIVIDDRSTDATGAIADAVAAQDARVRVVHVQSLPPDWLGKVHAMARGAELATGEWLLFSDADVHLAPGALRRAVGYCEARGLDHLGVVPTLGNAGYWVAVILSTLCRMMIAGMSVAAIEDPQSKAGCGVGAFNLVRKRALDRTPGLTWLKLELIDDMALGQMLKRAGARSSVALGETWVSLPYFYPSVRALMLGMEKNGFAALGRFSYVRLVATALGFITLECVPFVALLVPGPGLVHWVSLAVIVLALLSALCANRLFGQPLLAAPLFPIGTALLLGFGVRSGWLAARHGGIAWRGTRYSLSALREGSRLEFP